MAKGKVGGSRSFSARLPAYLAQGRQRKARGDKGDDPWRSETIDKVDMRNERFEKYYTAQNILAADEWAPFLEALREPLPTTFRVAGSRQSVAVPRVPSPRTNSC